MVEPCCVLEVDVVGELEIEALTSSFATRLLQHTTARAVGSPRAGAPGFLLRLSSFGFQLSTFSFSPSARHALRPYDLLGLHGYDLYGLALLLQALVVVHAGKVEASGGLAASITGLYFPNHSEHFTAGT